MSDKHGAEPDDLDDDSEKPARTLDELRARRVARREPPDDGPGDPFTQDNMDQIIDDIDQRITTIALGDAWLRVTYRPRPPIRLLDFAMGPAGSDEPLVNLLITNHDTHDMIRQIIATIGPDDRPAPDPDPAPRPSTQW